MKPTTIKSMHMGKKHGNPKDQQQLVTKN